jgi:hypothetical protein
MTTTIITPTSTASQQALVSYVERYQPLTRIIVKEPPGHYHISALADRRLAQNVHLIRGQKVMLDSDLAVFYGVQLKYIKAHVRRSTKRFPEGCMFTLTAEEAQAIRSRHTTMDQRIKQPIFAFNERGILTLAMVLRSEQAIAVSLRLVGLFLRMRDVLAMNQDILLRLDHMAERAGGDSAAFQTLLQDLEQLLALATDPHSA